MRAIFITDYTEQFAYRLLKGIHNYAKESSEPWVVAKMPTSYKRQVGLEGIVQWAKKWDMKAVIGQFEPDDDISLFRKNGIVAIAQDNVRLFKEIPNITADYEGTGAMAAELFISRGYKNFAFLGHKGLCWSEARRDGFTRKLKESGFTNIFVKELEPQEDFWQTDYISLLKWISTLPKPVAVMTCDDNQGAIFLELCKVNGTQVPAEVAIIGVDNDEILCTMSSPTLSSIDVDIELGGYQVAALMERMVKEHRFEGEDIVLKPTSIIPRTSSNVFATKDNYVHAALEFIRANAHRKIGVSDVLEVVPVSRRLLEQRFLKETGMTIFHLITMVRINRFARMLLETKDSVAEIAAQLDEPDAKSISRRFQAIKGCTPTEFRKRNLRKMGV
ncbi:MAG: DNA-binding transcriptional regulator [Bacteroidales bacterium]|nr:DNA-binding transcriptional regulator [Bacteroidales bacterium]